MSKNTFELPKLLYSYSALEPFIDEQTMHLHHDKHHQTYVDNLNKALEGHDDLSSINIDELIKNLDKVPEDIRMKVRNNAGGHANHIMFWKVMIPNSQFKPVSGKLLELINATFGSFETFQEKFSEAALSRFGSGWAWLTVIGDKLEVTSTPNQDTPWIDHRNAILGLDVWEHSYYLKYQNKRADYIKAWWNVVNWSHVEHHFDIASK